MATEPKAKGPASYFPSIEKTYGRPISHWLSLLDSMKDRKHMEAVSFLKSEHNMGMVMRMHSSPIIALSPRPDDCSKPMRRYF
jgi:hypothetical protein